MLKYVLIISILFVAAECTKCCPKNEIYSECGNNGCQNTCKNPNIGIVCKAMCISGCICMEGYLRNTKGICVPAKDCDTCGPYEIFDLKRNTECVNTCDNPVKETECVPNMPLAGCICKDGFVRNDKKICVKLSECTSCGGDPNAIWSSCGDSCPITCANKDLGIMCAAVCQKKGSCRCKTGFVRNIYNKCIRPDQCPKCGKNEFFDCGSACDTTCATLGETCPIVNIKCNEMCYCVKGYARNSNGICIPISQCPPKQCKDDSNALITECGDPCPVTCENKNRLTPCPYECIPFGKMCKQGFVLDSRGQCIPYKKCPIPKCDENEVYDRCPPKCPPERTCASYISGIMYKCPAPTETDCIPSCRCKPDYVRNDKGKCIKPINCCSDPNAELVECPNPCPLTCDNLLTPIRPCSRMCLRLGCQCKAGYVIGPNGKCILPKSCPNLKCNKNEILVDCAPSCPPEETCSSYMSGIVYDCAPPPPDRVCMPSCRCKPGCIRNDKRMCVPINDCCQDPNAEVVNCPNPCPGGTCANPEFMKCKKYCVFRGCQCKQGYVKKSDTDPTCIQLKYCPCYK